MSEIINNRAARVETLKGIIQDLHAGVAVEDVRRRMAELVRQTDHSEIVAMEQELIAGGMALNEITRMCDLHSQVTRDVLVQLGPKPLPAGHPADTFRRENQALRDALAEVRRAEDSMALRQALNSLMDIDKHYQRKEHCFFSKLEQHGVAGPSKVMWAKDDEVRAKLKEVMSVARRGEDFRPAVLAAVAAVEEMMYKEEQILLPMCLDLFTEEDWGEIWVASPRYGWCLVEPREGYRPPEAVQEAAALNSGSMTLPTGTLSLEQLTAVFSTLPVDLTFVNADDRVAFFSEGPNRVFARSRAVIGRKVQNCHPPRSVGVVDRILEDFRSGRQSVAEFWINFQGRFVHIRYFAVRSEQGEYLGTLEVTQDATAIRGLEGERRLLEYETEVIAG